MGLAVAAQNVRRSGVRYESLSRSAKMQKSREYTRYSYCNMSVALPNKQIE